MTQEEQMPCLNNEPAASSLHEAMLDPSIATWIVECDKDGLPLHSFRDIFKDKYEHRINDNM